MLGELITLPIRLSTRVAQVTLRAGLKTSERALSLAGDVVGLFRSEGASAPDSDFAPGEPAPEPGPTPREPTHVSEQSVLVRELAEPGAEDGAGAEVNVMEPWDGYDGLSAKDVVARLQDADPAELAAAQLYESLNRRRESVLSAAERQLRSTTG